MKIQSNSVKIYIQICREGIILPKYAKTGDAGMDICAGVDIMISPGETKVVPTGIKLAIPKGYEIQVRPRSGLSLKTPMRISNSPGTIDSGFRDEVGIIMTNTSPPTLNNSQELLLMDQKDNKSGTYLVRKGDRIAQIVLMEVPIIEFEEVENVDKIGNNRGGGFGSTGV